MAFLHTSSTNQSVESFGDFVGRRPLRGARNQKPFSVVSKLCPSKARVFRGRLFGSQRFVFDSRLENLSLSLGSVTKAIRLHGIRSAVDRAGRPRHPLARTARVIVTVHQQEGSRPVIDYKIDVPCPEVRGRFVRYTEEASGRGLVGKVKNRADDDVTASAYVRRYASYNPQFSNQPHFKLDSTEVNRAIPLNIVPSEPRVIGHVNAQQPVPDPLGGPTTPATQAGERNPAVGVASAVAVSPASPQHQVPTRSDTSLVGIINRVRSVANRLRFSMPSAQRLIDAIIADEFTDASELFALLDDREFLQSVCDELEGLDHRLSDLRKVPGNRTDVLELAQQDVGNFWDWAEGHMEGSDPEYSDADGSAVSGNDQS